MKDQSLSSFEEEYNEYLEYPEEYVQNVIKRIKSNSDMNGINLPLFTAHEALSLEYESGLTRSKNNKTYDLSGHFIWIGERTRRVDHAHVEFMRGIQNPIGVKVSSKFTEDEFIELVRKLNPMNELNRLVVIIRMGSEIERLNDLI